MVINLISPSGRFTSVALIERFIGSDARMEVSDQAGEEEMPSHGWTDHADVFMVSLSCLVIKHCDVARFYWNSVKFVVADDKLMIRCGISRRLHAKLKEMYAFPGWRSCCFNIYNRCKPHVFPDFTFSSWHRALRDFDFLRLDCQRSSLRFIFGEKSIAWDLKEKSYV